MIEFLEEKSPSFEIVLLDKDSKGQLTGKKTSFASNEATQIASFFEKHEAMMAAKQRKNKNKKKNKKS